MKLSKLLRYMILMEARKAEGLVESNPHRPALDLTPATTVKLSLQSLIRDQDQVKDRTLTLT